MTQEVKNLIDRWDQELNRLNEKANCPMIYNSYNGPAVCRKYRERSDDLSIRIQQLKHALGIR